MGKVTYSDGIAIYKLIYYSPCLFASIYVAWTHGFSKNSGWIFLTIFCIIRLIGASAQIATIANPGDQTAITVALITSELGLSPLLLASLGLLSRAYYSILKQPWSTFFTLIILKAVQTPAAIALVLCIVGATSANNPAVIDSETTVHIGIILFAVVFVALVLLDGGALLARRMTGRGEDALVFSVAVALPFLAVRVLFSILAAFSHDRQFNPATGSETVALFMEVQEEMVVVLIYICAGLKLKTVPEGDRSAGENIGYRFGRGDFGGGKLGILSLGVAAVQARSGDKPRATQQQQSRERWHYVPHRKMDTEMGEESSI